MNDAATSRESAPGTGLPEVGRPGRIRRWLVLAVALLAAATLTMNWVVRQQERRSQFETMRHDWQEEERYYSSQGITREQRGYPRLDTISTGKPAWSYSADGLTLLRWEHYQKEQLVSTTSALVPSDGDTVLFWEAASVY